MSYYDDVRAFAKGNITEENDNCRVCRVRIPKYVYNELQVLAQERNVKTGRLMIEVLRTVADKSIAKKKATQDMIDSFEPT